MTKIQHTRRGRPAAIAESDEKQVIKDYKKLGSVKAVAEKWSVSYPTIRKLLLKHDVKISGAVSPSRRLRLSRCRVGDGNAGQGQGRHQALPVCAGEGPPTLERKWPRRYGPPGPAFSQVKGLTKPQHPAFVTGKD